MRKNPSLPAALAVALCTLTVGVADAGQQVTLRWQFEPGESLVYLTTMTNETELPDMGTMVMEQVMTNRWEVTEVSDEGEATVQVSTDRVQMRVQGPMGNMQFDSDAEAPASDPAGMGRMVTAMAGTSYGLVFDASGQIKEVLGVEEMRQRLLAATKQAANPMVSQALEQFASEDGIKNMMRQGFAAWPQDPVAPGDSWDAGFDLTVPMVGAMSYAMTLTFDHVEPRDGGPVAVINAVGSIEVVPDDSPGNPAAGMVSIDDTTINGSMEWDIDRGRLLRTTQDGTMTLSVAAGGQQVEMMTFSHLVLELTEGG
jgi:hypothetical protein